MEGKHIARVMNQTNKAKWLASRIDDGSIRTQRQLVSISCDIQASDKVLGMTRDNYKELQPV